MKKILIIILALFLFTSCSEITTNSTNVEQPPVYTVIEFDSCEYVIRYENSPTWNSMAHKGNCKFCEKRK